MRRTFLVILLGLSLLNPLPMAAQEPVDASVNERIEREGMNNSRIMQTLHYLTDMYGPRLTGSPYHKAAAEWAAKEMTKWGLANARLEPWDFGHPGWLNERLTAHIISPVKDHLTGEVLAWTPSTPGVVTAQAFHLIPPDRPTAEQLTAYLESVKERVRGKIVLVGKHQFVPVTITPSTRRVEDAQLRQRFDPNNQNADQRPPFARGQQGPPPQPGVLNPRQIAEQIDAFLVANGAAVRIDDGGREHGQIRAFHNRTFDPSKVVPTVILRNEDFGRISRLLANGSPVELEFNVVNRIYPEGRTSYNVVAEIPGTDKGDEVIMLGGHLDSWHAATGATDNAIGCAVMMEAARIIHSLGLKPRRTIRVALWGGEEQGLLGSLAYVKEHFGTAENPKPAYEKFGGYFNIDTGTGRVRGLTVFGPPEAASVIREIIAPFEKFGVMGAAASRSRGLGGSDHTSFNQAGLPGIGAMQDPIEYGSATWHTNLDTYERIIEDDARKSAVVIASAVYHLAMRDQLLPRFAGDQMPQPPGARPATPPVTPAAPARQGNR
ncbi:MAG: M20/M25/M40 family metallo-hydrolase [Blastocatellales bacterium]|nr:M20/M25/M40 family metallo-hydrolase [Blastocatellales bacterium]